MSTSISGEKTESGRQFLFPRRPCYCSVPWADWSVAIRCTTINSCPGKMLEYYRNILDIHVNRLVAADVQGLAPGFCQPRRGTTRTYFHCIREHHHMERQELARCMGSPKDFGKPSLLLEECKSWREVHTVMRSACRIFCHDVQYVSNAPCHINPTYLRHRYALP